MSGPVSSDWRHGRSLTDAGVGEGDIGRFSRFSALHLAALCGCAAGVEQLLQQSAAHFCLGHPPPETPRMVKDFEFS